MTAQEFTWTPEALARRRKIGITIIVVGLSILGLILYKLAIHQWRNQMLLKAAVDNDPKRVQELLENGADCRATDVYGASTLMRAAGSAHAVKLLLEKCPDITAEEKTAVLVRAAYWNNVGTVKVLLDKGANINDRSRSGWNALMTAASKGHFGVASLLVESGADIDAKDQEGRDALMLACEHHMYAGAPGDDHFEIIQLLLEKGVDVNANDSQGRTAMSRIGDWNWQERCKDIVDLLKAHGAKE